jgi:hypothetical protein
MGHSTSTLTGSIVERSVGFWRGGARGSSLCGLARWGVFQGEVKAQCRWWDTTDYCFFFFLGLPDSVWIVVSGVIWWKLGWLSDLSTKP